MDVLLILLIVFLFAALPTLPYSASGRTRYEHHHAGEPEHGVEPAKANSQVLRSLFRYSFLGTWPLSSEKLRSNFFL
jgi:hypothetical protein